MDLQFLKKPYDDERMEYDWELDLYVIKPSYLMEKWGLDLTKILKPDFMADPQKRAQLFCLRVADITKSYIFDHNADNQYQQWLYDCNPIFRGMLLTAMRHQLMGMLTTGDLALYSGVNLKTGQIMKKSELRDAAINGMCHSELSKIIPGINVSIIYQGQFQRPTGYVIGKEQ